MKTEVSRYRDRPMDFADATLVYLHSGFDTYRIEGRKCFRLLPAMRP